MTIQYEEPRPYRDSAIHLKAIRLAVGIAAIALIATGCTRSGAPPPSPTHGPADVTDYRGGLARTGQMPGPGLRGSGVALWRYADRSTIGFPPSVTAGQVLVPEDQTLTALDLATGARLWAVPLGAAIIAPIAVASNVAYATTTDNVLHAINLATRQERWRFDGAAAGTQVSTVDRTVYLATLRHELVALDTANGGRRWSVGTGHASGRIAIADGVAYVGGDGSGLLTAINLGEHRVLWTFDTHSDKVATPAVDRGTVFVAGVAAGGLAGRNTNLFALDAASGDEKWRFAPPSDPPMAAFAIGGSDVFIGTDSAPGTLYAVARDTGKIHWQVPVAGAVDRPALVGDVVYVAAGLGGLHAFDVRTGRPLWTSPVAGFAEGVVVTDGLAVVTAHDAPDAPGAITAVVGADDSRTAADLHGVPSTS